MSHNHRELGHFSQRQRTNMLRLYKFTCPCCGHQATQMDHIFALDFYELSKAFGVLDIHADENGWVICSKCHAQKTKEEYKAYRDGAAISKVYNKWWKKAFTSSGKRRYWKGETIKKGARARRNRILIRNRQRLKQKMAA